MNSNDILKGVYEDFFKVEKANETTKENIDIKDIFDKINNTGIMDNKILLSPLCKLCMPTYNIYKPC